MPIKTAIFHGPSGSGKDTQLDLLEKDYQFIRIGSSQVMRDLKEEGHPLAIKADEYGKKGVLYPDEIMYGMFQVWLDRADREANWWFVGPVRKNTQVKMFDELIAKFDRKLDLFVHFDLSEEVAIERMSLRNVCPVCQTTYHDIYKKEKKKGFCDNDGEKLIHREDDQPEAIAKRLSWYKDDLAPILKEYEKRRILLEIDATPSIEEIYTDLLVKMKNYENRV